VLYGKYWQWKLAEGACNYFLYLYIILLFIIIIIMLYLVEIILCVLQIKI